MNNGAADAYMGGRKGIGLGTILKAAGAGAGVGALIGSSTERFLHANAVGTAANVVPILNPIESFFEPKSLLGEVASRFATSTISRNVFAEIKMSSRITDIESGNITIDDILNTDY